MLIAGLSVVLSRPIFRRQEETPRRLSWFASSRSRHVLRRSPCGSDAMLWKERHFTRTDVFTKLVALPATVLLTVGLILGSRLDEAVGRVWKRFDPTGTHRGRRGYSDRSFSAR